MELADTYTEFASLQLDQGKFDEAMKSFAQVQAIREKLVREHPDVVQYQSDLAAVYANTATLLARIGSRETRSFSKSRHSMLLDKLTRDHPSFPALWNQLGAIEMNIGINQIETGDRPGSITSFRRRARSVQALAQSTLQTS